MARIGRHPAALWQFSQGMVSRPWGLRVVSFWGAFADVVGAAGVRPPVAPATNGKQRRAERANWSSARVHCSLDAKFVAMLGNPAAGCCTKLSDVLLGAATVLPISSWPGSFIPWPVLQAGLYYL
jgi:hypothetical protein